MWSWTLTVQREIKSGFLVEAGYSAIIGTHLIASLLNYDQVDTNTAGETEHIYRRRPQPAEHDLRQQEPASRAGRLQQA